MPSGVDPLAPVRPRASVVATFIPCYAQFENRIRNKLHTVMANPTGRGGFRKGGPSPNPGGRPRRHIGDLSREARRYASLALGTLVRICKEGAERNQLAAATALLDRGYGKPVQAID